MILSQNIRTILNLVPNSIEVNLSSSINNANFLQPLEILDGQSICDLKLTSPLEMEESLQNIAEAERDRMSLLEIWLSDFTEEARDELYSLDQNLPKFDEVSRDPSFSSPLLRCISDEENQLQSSMERLLKYIFGQAPSYNYNSMLMVAMPYILDFKETSIQFGKFFVDSPNADINVYNPSTRLTFHLKNSDLPQFARNRVKIQEFPEIIKEKYTDISKFISRFIKDTATNLDMAEIPVQHFFVDFRNQIL